MMGTCKTCKWWVVPNALLGTPNEARVCRSEFVDRDGSNPFSTKIKIQAVTLTGEKIKDYYTVTEADIITRSQKQILAVLNIWM